MKTFRTLKPGDNIYILNTGTGVGYLTIESYEVIKPFVRKSFGLYNGIHVAVLKNYFTELMIDESYLDESVAGNYFCYEESAKQAYVEKSKEILNELRDESEMHIKQLAYITACSNNIRKRAEEFNNELKELKV